MIVAVTGGRDLTDRARVARALDLFVDHPPRPRPITLLRHGACRGLDVAAGAWADGRGIVVEAYAADWRQGRSAGPKRNRRMLLGEHPYAAEPVRAALLLAFPGGRGTASCVGLARQLGIPVLHCRAL